MYVCMYGPIGLISFWSEERDRFFGPLLLGADITAVLVRAIGEGIRRAVVTESLPDVSTISWQQATDSHLHLICSANARIL